MEYYIEITHGRFVEGGMKTDIIRFEYEDLSKIRHHALLTARFFDAFVSEENNIDHPSLAKDIPAFAMNVDAFSLVVYFKDEYNDVHQIYGPEIHENLVGLANEAQYYLRKNLVTEEQLVTILQNIKNEDQEGGEITYVIMDKDGETELPDFDFDVIKILPDDIALLLGEHRTGDNHPLKIGEINSENDDEEEDYEDEDED